MATGPVDAAAVEAALRDFKDPESGRGVVEMGQVSDVRVDGDSAGFTLALTTHTAPLWGEVRAAAGDHVRRKLPALSNVEVGSAVHPRPPQKMGTIGLTAKNVIAVGSGKGGVGKSTLAVSLALGLRRAGSRVGLMDADVYGPSVPHLLGLTGQLEKSENGKIKPIECGGMPVVSMAFIVPPGEAVVWRGPMLHGAITQFLRDTDWGELDYLVVDMPPGTGDIALTLAQSLSSAAGAVVVCTPQDVALLDAVKAIAMFRKVKIPILGMIENMSGFVCPDCHKRHEIFGSGGARERSAELEIPFLGEVPINTLIRSLGDQGATEAVFEDGVTAACFDKLAQGLVRNLATTASQEPPLPELPVLG